MKKFATLTIGQAPRPDLAPVFNAIAPAGTEVVHAGCLDGLTKAEVDELFDGNPPFKGRGAVSFAMNVAEILRVLKLLSKYY